MESLETSSPNTEGDLTQPERDLLERKPVMMFEVFPELDEIRASLAPEFQASFDQEFEPYRDQQSHLGVIFAQIDYFSMRRSVPEAWEEAVYETEAFERLREHFLILKKITRQQHQAELEAAVQGEAPVEIDQATQESTAQAQAMLAELNPRIESTRKFLDENPGSSEAAILTELEAEKTYWEGILRNNGVEVGGGQHAQSEIQ